MAKFHYLSFGFGQNEKLLFQSNTTIFIHTEDSMLGSICWELNLQDSGMSARSIEVDLITHTPDHCHCFMIGDDGIFRDIALGSIWKSEALSGSKRLTLVAMTSGGKESTLMRAKVAHVGDGDILRIVVKLQGKLTQYE